MAMFCPTCGSMLPVVQHSVGYMFRCRSCPYKYDIQKKIVNPLKLQKKEVDDILGGEDAWENVDSTESTYRKP